MSTHGVANLKRFRGSQSAAEACAVEVVGWLAHALDRNPDEWASLAISGGKSPGFMFQIFRDLPFRWDRVHLFWVDERCVPPDHVRSNFKMAHDIWLGPSNYPAANIHRVEGELDPKQAAARYVEQIRNTFSLKDGQLPRFDVIHRGMGDDAHTASLFPGQPLIADQHNIAASVYVEKFSEWRVTLLPGVLASAQHTAMLVAGKDKAEPLQHVLNDSYQPMLFPAQLAALDERTVWFVDSAAAGSK